MTVFKIKKGRTLPIQGDPAPQFETASGSGQFALLPPDFEGIKFKLEVREGDRVKVGTPLLSSRANSRVLFTSPAGGSVAAINRGARRKLLDIVISPSEPEEFEKFKAYTLAEICRLSREIIIEALLKSGLWPYIIQRPFSRIANPEAEPKSIFINAMNTEPNCADREILLEGNESAFQAGITALGRLTGGRVFLCHDGGKSSPVAAVSKAHDCEKHQFTGPHPTGNVGTHIHFLDPINKGDIVWHVNAEQVAVIGQFLLDGKIPVERTIAVAGSSATNRKYYKTRLGATLQSLVGDNVEQGDVRYINGGVLTGKTVNSSGFTGFYNNTVTLIPEGGKKEVMGWLRPGSGKPSFSRMFLSALFPGRKNIQDTKVNGERRAIVASHIYDPLVTLEVPTVFLVKSCLAKDVEEMENLGLLECAPEDFSLCTYACVSKIEVDSVIREGLDLLEKES